MRGLGPLEATVMQRLWTCDEPQSVRLVHEALMESREIAYTTVMTVMDNLHRKGFLVRDRIGRAYVYSASGDREQHTAALLGEVLADGGDRTGVLLRFVEQLSDVEIAALQRAVSEARSVDRDGERA